jgi:hypothetical protein
MLVRIISKKKTYGRRVIPPCPRLEILPGLVPCKLTSFTGTVYYYTQNGNSKIGQSFLTSGCFLRGDLSIKGSFITTSNLKEETRYKTAASMKSSQDPYSLELGDKILHSVIL